MVVAKSNLPSAAATPKMKAGESVNCQSQTGASNFSAKWGTKIRDRKFSPSKELRRPDRLSVEPSSLELVDEELLVAEVELELGAPVELASLETPLVKAASKSK